MNILGKLKDIIEGTIYESAVFLGGGSARDFITGKTLKSKSTIELYIRFGNGGSVFGNWLKSKYPKDVKDYIELPNFACIFNYDDYSFICMSEVGQETTLKYKEFYCNTLLYNISTGDIEDPTGKGLEHCYNKEISVISGIKLNSYSIFSALILVHEDNFSISSDKLLITYNYLDLISPKLLKDSFSRLLMSKNPVKAIKDLHFYTVLKLVSPELEKAWEFDQCSKYHSMNLTEHLFSVLDIVSKSKYGNDLRLRLAALFHDISKYSDFTFDGTYKHFKGHEKTSAVLAEKILRNLKYDEDIISDVKVLISNHMRLKQNYNNKEGIFEGSDKTIRRFYRSLGNLAELELELIEADNMSHAPKYCMPNQVSSLRDRWSKMSKSQVNNVSGKKIIDFLGIKSGKSVGDIKRKLSDLLDEFPEDSEELLLERYKKHYSGKKIYLIKQCGKYFASITDLLYDPAFDTYSIKDKNPTYSLVEIEEDTRYKNLTEKRTELSAIEFPQIYDKLEKDHKIREIMSRVSMELNNLKFIDGFMKAKITFRSNFSSTIDLDDGTTFEIL